MPAMRVLSELWSRWIRTQRLIRKHEDDPKLELAYIRTGDKLETQMLRYLQEFGMTPSGRGKITIVGRSADDDEGFLD